MMYAKQIKIGLSKHFGFDEFQSRYGCSEEELISEVHRIYNRSDEYAESLVKQIKENTEMSRKRNARKMAKCQEPNTADALEGIISNHAKTIQSLQVEEKILSDKAILFEGQVKHLGQERLSIIRRLRNLQVRRSELEEAIKRLNEEYNGAVTEANDLLSDIQRLRQEHQPVEAQLAQVREKLAAAEEKVIILVYADGMIKYSTSESPSVDTSSSRSIAEELLWQPYCKALTIGDVQTLAKVITIALTMEREAVVRFEKPELASAYDQYIGA